MSRINVKLKDAAGNYLYPLCNMDSDGNVIKTTYLNVRYINQLVKNSVILYAYSEADEAPEDEEFVEDPSQLDKKTYLWQALFITYLNGSTQLGKKINLTKALNN